MNIILLMSFLFLTTFSINAADNGSEKALSLTSFSDSSSEAPDQDLVIVTRDGKRIILTGDDGKELQDGVRVDLRRKVPAAAFLVLLTGRVGQSVAVAGSAVCDGARVIFNSVAKFIDVRSLRQLGSYPSQMEMWQKHDALRAQQSEVMVTASKIVTPQIATDVQEARSLVVRLSSCFMRAPLSREEVVFGMREAAFIERMTDLGQSVILIKYQESTLDERQQWIQNLVKMNWFKDTSAANLTCLADGTSVTQLEEDDNK